MLAAFVALAAGGSACECVVRSSYWQYIETNSNCKTHNDKDDCCSSDTTHYYRRGCAENNRKCKDDFRLENQCAKSVVEYCIENDFCGPHGTCVKGHPHEYMCNCKPGYFGVTGTQTATNPNGNCRAASAAPFDSCNTLKCGSLCFTELCGRECKAKECATSCSGESCGVDCVGNLCAHHCVGNGCGAGCTGPECAIQCDGFKCGTQCTGNKCAAECTGDYCGQLCEGPNCACECTGKNCGFECRGEKCGPAECCNGREWAVCTNGTPIRSCFDTKKDHCEKCNSGYHLTLQETCAVTTTTPTTTSVTTTSNGGTTTTTTTTTRTTWHDFEFVTRGHCKQPLSVLECDRLRVSGGFVGNHTIASNGNPFYNVKDRSKSGYDYRPAGCSIYAKTILDDGLLNDPDLVDTSEGFIFYSSRKEATVSCTPNLASHGHLGCLCGAVADGAAYILSDSDHITVPEPFCCQETEVYDAGMTTVREGATTCDAVGPSKRKLDFHAIHTCVSGHRCCAMCCTSVGPVWEGDFSNGQCPEGSSTDQCGPLTGTVGMVHEFRPCCSLLNGKIYNGANGVCVGGDITLSPFQANSTVTQIKAVDARDAECKWEHENQHTHFSYASSKSQTVESMEYKTTVLCCPTDGSSDSTEFVQAAGYGGGVVTCDAASERVGFTYRTLVGLADSKLTCDVHNPSHHLARACVMQTKYVVSSFSSEFIDLPAKDDVCRQATTPSDSTTPRDAFYSTESEPLIIDFLNRYPDTDSDDPYYDEAMDARARAEYKVAFQTYRSGSRKMLEFLDGTGTAGIRARSTLTITINNTEYAFTVAEVVSSVRIFATANTAKPISVLSDRTPVTVVVHPNLERGAFKYTPLWCLSGVDSGTASGLCYKHCNRHDECNAYTVVSRQVGDPAVLRMSCVLHHLVSDSSSSAPLGLADVVARTDRVKEIEKEVDEASVLFTCETTDARANASNRTEGDTSVVHLSNALNHANVPIANVGTTSTTVTTVHSARHVCCANYLWRYSAVDVCADVDDVQVATTLCHVDPAQGVALPGYRRSLAACCYAFDLYREAYDVAKDEVACPPHTEQTVGSVPCADIKRPSYTTCCDGASGHAKPPAQIAVGGKYYACPVNTTYQNSKERCRKSLDLLRDIESPHIIFWVAFVLTCIVYTALLCCNVAGRLDGDKVYQPLPQDNKYGGLVQQNSPQDGALPPYRFEEPSAPPAYINTSLVTLASFFGVARRQASNGNRRQLDARKGVALALNLYTFFVSAASVMAAGRLRGSYETEVVVFGLTESVWIRSFHRVAITSAVLSGVQTVLVSMVLLLNNDKSTAFGRVVSDGVSAMLPDLPDSDGGHGVPITIAIAAVVLQMVNFPSLIMTFVVVTYFAKTLHEGNPFTESSDVSETTAVVLVSGVILHCIPFCALWNSLLNIWRRDGKKGKDYAYFLLTLGSRLVHAGLVFVSHVTILGAESTGVAPEDASFFRTTIVLVAIMLAAQAFFVPRVSISAPSSASKSTSPPSTDMAPLDVAVRFCAAALVCAGAFMLNADITLAQSLKTPRVIVGIYYMMVGMAVSTAAYGSVFAWTCARNCCKVDTPTGKVAEPASQPIF